MRLDVFLFLDLKSTHLSWQARVITLREVVFYGAPGVPRFQGRHPIVSPDLVMPHRQNSPGKIASIDGTVHAKNALRLALRGHSRLRCGVVPHLVVPSSGILPESFSLPGEQERLHRKQSKPKLISDHSRI